MGIYSDLATTLGGSKPRAGNLRSTAHQLESFPLDRPVQTSYAAQSEVTRIAQLGGSPSGGTYTLTVDFPVLGITYTTANIAYNATAATIEAALDTASPAAIGDGDLAVSEEASAGVSDGYIDITAEDTAADTPVLISIDATNVTGGTAGTVTRTTPGQGDRKAVQALFDSATVTGTVPNSGVAPTDWTKPSRIGQTRLREHQIRDLALQAVKEEGLEAYYTAVAALYSFPR